MAKRSLAQATKAQPKRTALDLATEQAEGPVAARPIGRSTDRISVSLLAQERTDLERRARELQDAGRRDIKTSRLARIAFRMVLNASDEEILQIADEVDNLEVRRAGK